MGRLDGKVVVVPGASRGIGADVARLFASEGGRVVCAARTVQEGQHPLAGSLENTVAAIHEAGGDAHAVGANIAEPAECERLIRETRQRYGPIDVLVNNAALTYYVRVKDYPVGKWLRSWAVNFQAAFVLSQLVLADMVPAPERGDREHLLGLRHRTRARALPGSGGGRARRHLLRSREGRARALHPGPRLRGVPVRYLGHLGRPLAGGADPGHRVSPPRHRSGRPARGAADPDGARRAPPRHRAGRAGERPSDLQPADPPRVRLDRGRARPGRRLPRQRLLGDLAGDVAADGPTRLVVMVGATAAGKSTLARRLAGGLGVDFVELDALFWGPGWAPSEPAAFRARVEAATAGPARGVAGNYAAVRDLLWPRADTILWLHYPLPPL